MFEEFIESLVKSLYLGFIIRFLSSLLLVVTYVWLQYICETVLAFLSKLNVLIEEKVFLLVNLVNRIWLTQIFSII